MEFIALSLVNNAKVEVRNQMKLDHVIEQTFDAYFHWNQLLDYPLASPQATLVTDLLAFWIFSIY